MDLIINERNSILDWKNAKGPIALFNMFKDLATTTWHGMVCNSYYRAL
jgi:hypothetical protein